MRPSTPPDAAPPVTGHSEFPRAANSNRPMAAPSDGEVYDYVIVGSGFGGSVSALRLVEKGYRVLMLEKGSELKAEDFPENNWDIKRWLWAPAIGFRGLFQMRPFRHVSVLAGSGVGGGSLTYANTLPIPKRGFFQGPHWKDLADWETELAPHYQEARRMLGAAPSDFLSPADSLLKQLAVDSGMPEAFEKPHVAVYFGEAGKKHPDPYFGGKGPERSGCIRCGACMTGCKHGAKNTLDKNYLYFARKGGLSLLADTEVVHVAPGITGQGYRIKALTGKSYFRRKQVAFEARNVVFSGGALGTNSLLLRLQADKTALPNLSPMLGRRVRTNSESLLLVTDSNPAVDHSTGIAINSLLQTDEHSHLEMTRYGKGSGFFRLFYVPHARGRAGFLQLFRIILACLKQPLRTLRAMMVRDWARSTMVLLYMRSTEGTLRFTRGLFGVMTTQLEGGEAPKATIPEATDLALKLADMTGGIAMNATYEPLLDVPTTAHILGGCPMGASAETGVIDSSHRVFGYDGLYVVDGSAISANPGVNPSLSITALAERAMSLIPAKAALTTTRPGGPRRLPAPAAAALAYVRSA
ncbi:MAG: oxidoreductase family protein [Myxococcaceae bacterium]|nr:oxidoreductase family protein [Myxococcaceae bacterium]